MYVSMYVGMNVIRTKRLNLRYINTNKMASSASVDTDLNS